MELAPGASVTPELSLVRPLSSGAMGAVWVARTTQGQEVAIKFVLAKMARDRATRLRFTREAEAAAQIVHANVVRLLQHGAAHDGTPFITMELLEGEGLGAKLEREQRVPLYDAAAILRQTGNALDAAHARGIIHRDIKPDNLFLVGGRVSQLKVLDFGMAKQVRHTTTDKAGSEVTATGVAVGTPDYMSPEQVLGAKDVDLRSDLWALGVVIYRSLTGRLPFSGPNPHALFFNICKGKYPPLEDHGVSPALDPWFRQALAPNKKQRFGSAREMVLRFESILRQHADQVEDGDESTHVFSMGLLAETTSGLAETHDGASSASTQSLPAHTPDDIDDEVSDDDEDFATLHLDPEATRRALEGLSFDPTASAALPLVRPSERDRLQSIPEHHAHRPELGSRPPLPSHPGGTSGVRPPLPSAPPLRAPLPSAPPQRASLPSAASARRDDVPSSRQGSLPATSAAAERPPDRGLWKVLVAAAVLASGIGAVFVLRTGQDDAPSEDVPPKAALPSPAPDPRPKASPPSEPATTVPLADDGEGAKAAAPTPEPEVKPASKPAPARPKPSPRVAPPPPPPPPAPPPPPPPAPDPPAPAPPAPPAPEPATPEPPAPAPAPPPPPPAEPAPEPAPAPPPSEAPVVDQPEF